MLLSGCSSVTGGAVVVEVVVATTDVVVGGTVVATGTVVVARVSSVIAECSVTFVDWALYDTTTKQIVMATVTSFFMFVLVRNPRLPIVHTNQAGSYGKA